MQQKKRSSRWNARAMERALELTKMTAPETDPQGSYTGRTPDGSRPVQDADDL